MNKNVRKYNLNEAYATYGKPNYQTGTSYIKWPGKPLDYSPAYVVTNEDLRYTTGLTSDMARRVLTVAGSGDQAMFYTLNGATQVDTFDISYCARAIMEIKVQAIKSGMPYEKYVRLLRDLYAKPSASKVDGMGEILPKISAHCAQFVRNMDGYRIFGNGVRPEYYYDKELVSKQEYEQLKKQLSKQFKFIWSDVADLHTQLVGEYDVINLSNIFEWNPNIIQKTLLSLRPHVRVGGYILVHTGPGMSVYKNMEKYQQAADAFKDWAKMGINNTKSFDNIVMLERVR